MTRIVLDTSVFFSSFPCSGDLSTTWSVVAELRDLRSKARLDILRESGLEIRDPGPESLARAREASIKSGEKESLSQTDLDILALALELGGSVCTDDYALQNVARRLGIEVIPIRQKGGSGKRWYYRCSGCGKYGKGPGECPVCGSPFKRRIK